MTADEVFLRSELVAMRADGMPKDREEWQGLLNGAYNKGRDDTHALYQSGIPMTLIRSELERTREELARVQLLLEEVTDWYIQPYAGARRECLFCGKHEGSPHDDDCFSVKVRAVLERKEEA